MALADGAVDIPDAHQVDDLGDILPVDQEPWSPVGTSLSVP